MPDDTATEISPEERRRLERKALEGSRRLAQEGRAGRAGRPKGSGALQPGVEPVRLHAPILEALARAGYDDLQICQLHCMVPSQFSRLLIAHPELQSAIDIGRSEIADLLTEELWRAAIERHEWQALKKLLKRYDI